MLKGCLQSHRITILTTGRQELRQCCGHALGVPRGGPHSGGKGVVVSRKGQEPGVVHRPGRAATADWREGGEEAVGSAGSSVA
jgi:hypothetical protein